MFSDDTQLVPIDARSPKPATRRSEFSHALEGYMAMYLAEQQRRGQRANRPLIWQLVTLVVGALHDLGSAITGGGRFPPAGIM